MLAGSFGLQVRRPTEYSLQPLMGWAAVVEAAAPTTTVVAGLAAVLVLAAPPAAVAEAPAGPAAVQGLTSMVGRQLWLQERGSPL